MAGGDSEEDLAAALAMSLQQPGAALSPPAQASATSAPGQASPSCPLSEAETAAALLHANPSGVLAQTDAVGVLSKLLSNIVKSPGEEKFRRVRLANAKISKVLACDGAQALLLAAGFSATEETLEVPAATCASELVARAEKALQALASIKVGPFMLSAQLQAEGPVRCVCALPGGGLATGAMDNLVRVYAPGCWEAPRVLSGHQQRAGVDGVLAVAAYGPGQLVSGGRDGKILHWRDGSVQSTLHGHGDGVQGTNVHVVSCLACRSDGTLFSGGWDKTLRMWQGGELSRVLQGHEVAVNSVAVLQGGYVASGSGDRTIGVWRDSERLRNLQASAPVRALCACGDGGLLASATNDGVARVWDVTTGRQLSEVKVADTYLLSISFNATSGDLAAGADDGTLAVMVLEDGGSKVCVIEKIQLCGEVYGLAFLESGDLAAACGDSSCSVWTRSAQRAASPALREEIAARAHALKVARAPASGNAFGDTDGSWDHSTNVTLGGRTMQLQWNIGEHAQLVARRFVERNGLDPAHTGDVITYVLRQQQLQQSLAGPPGGAAAAEAAATVGPYDFSYPVEVGDGRSLRINWNRGDDPQQVAFSFARQHGGIGANELPDIVKFVQQVSGEPSAPTFVQQVPSGQAPPSPAEQQQALSQVTAMGFGDAEARVALQASSWSVELAVQRLLG